MEMSRWELRSKKPVSLTLERHYQVDEIMTTFDVALLNISALGCTAVFSRTGIIPLTFCPGGTTACLNTCVPLYKKQPLTSDYKRELRSSRGRATHFYWLGSIGETMTLDVLRRPLEVSSDNIY